MSRARVDVATRGLVVAFIVHHSVTMSDVACVSKGDGRAEVDFLSLAVDSNRCFVFNDKLRVPLITNYGSCPTSLSCHSLDTY